MENDKQIKLMPLDEVKKVFLSDELLVRNAKPEIYSLPEEFAKSKKNRNFFAYALILLYIAIIGAGVYLITAAEETKNKRVEVNIAEFRQFNLLELLAEKKENEEKLTQLQQELEKLREDSLKEIKKLSPKEQQKAMAALNEKMKQLEESYLQKMKSKEAAIKELEKSIAREKQQIINESKETESAIKNYQNLAQMKEVELERLTADYEGKTARFQAEYQTEIARLRNDYEQKMAKLNADHKTEIENLKKDNQELITALILKYNPVYSKGEIAAALNSKLGNSSNGSLNKFSNILNDENVYNEHEFSQLRNKIGAQRVIINSLQSVPYTNSVPQALNRLERLSQSIIGDYENIWGSLVNRIMNKNSYINSYDYAFNYLTATRRENGYIIDTRNPNRLIVFIDRIYTVKKGDIAYVFKNDEETPSAKIELYPENDMITARAKVFLKPVKITPFDKILLKLEVAQ